MSLFKEVYPDYEYILWGNNNLTKANFPITYDIIQQLLKIDKQYKFSRMSMIGDLMKYEILLHHGGFYFDTNYQPFRSMDHLRNYEFIAVSQQEPYWSEYLATSFFAAAPQSPFLKRLLGQQNMDNLYLYSENPNFQTGPYFFVKAFTPNDYFYKLKILPPESVYPFESWAHDLGWKINRCAFEKNVREIPLSLAGTYEQVIETQKYNVIFPCKNQYSGEQYGINHFNLGGSWIKPRKN